MRKKEIKINYDMLEKEDIDEINAVLELYTLEEKYNYIYNKACEQLDEEFEENDYCNFVDGKCICQRKEMKIEPKTMRYKYKLRYTKETGLKVEAGLCYRLQGKKASQKCIACKLFTCKYLKKQKITLHPNDIFLIKIFFNKKQKSYIQKAFFKSQEEIVKELVRMNTKL